MRIPCPHCGARGHDEFVYRGDATPRGPDPAAPDAERAFDYVYLRDNPRGPAPRALVSRAAAAAHWLVVERDTRTHEIGRVATRARRERRRWAGA